MLRWCIDERCKSDEYRESRGQLIDNRDQCLLSAGRIGPRKGVDEDFQFPVTCTARSDLALRVLLHV